jgi:endonuclease YncB( thermonuclease family)
MALTSLAAVILLVTQAGVFKEPPRTPSETKWPQHKFSNKTPPASIGSMFNCSVASVTDGDTFRCANGVRVRLSSIDAPEMPGHCQPGRRCAPGNPYAAKSALARMITGRTVQCEPVGKTYGRVAAWCTFSGQDLSCAMVQSGHAIRLARSDREGRLCR